MHLLNGRIVLMKHYQLPGLICVFYLVLVLFVGSCFADEVPTYLTYVQGGKSAVSAASDGGYVVTIKDTVPFVVISYGGRDRLVPTERLINVTFPVRAALIVSDAQNDTTSMIQITNLSLSDDNKVLTLHVDPLPYYEGAALASFDADKQNIDSLVESHYGRSGLYFETIGQCPENSYDCTFWDYLFCLNGCGDTTWWCSKGECVCNEYGCYCPD